MKHSMLPWRICPRFARLIETGDGAHSLAEVRFGGWVLPEQARLNANIIVKAVNHHQIMADLLREGVSDMGNRERVEWKMRVEAMLKEMES